ncbi:MAG: response regulator, partial [Phycisphaerales bacterium]|nr:response regulator [Phycisphaerae bacterium]NNM26333.1 response regulator [Phycisphaerales bacterium]
YRVLVVEDDFFVAKSLGVLLTALDCEVVGPAPTVDEACELIKTSDIDAAVLDIALSPGTSAPVARALLYKECPFVFVTGYSSINMLPDDLRGYRVLLKPVDADTLADAIDEAVQRGKKQKKGKLRN